MSWYRPAGSLATDGARVLVTPEDAGWTYSGLRVVDLAEGPVILALDFEEAVIVPLSARDQGHAAQASGCSRCSSRVSRSEMRARACCNSSRSSGTGASAGTSRTSTFITGLPRPG